MFMLQLIDEPQRHMFAELFSARSLLYQLPWLLRHLEYVRTSLGKGPINVSYIRASVEVRAKHPCKGSDDAGEIVGPCSLSCFSKLDNHLMRRFKHVQPGPLDG